MPKTGGKDIDSCMEICMSDEKLKEEVPDDEERRSICYAACKEHLDSKQIQELILEYKNKNIK